MAGRAPTATAGGAAEAPAGATLDEEAAPDGAAASKVGESADPRLCLPAGGESMPPRR
jgi:hypothetical protein